MSYEVIRHLDYPDILSFFNAYPIIQDDPLIHDLVIQKNVDHLIQVHDGNLIKALLDSAENVNAPIIKELLTRGIDLNEAVNEASRKGHLDVVNLLLENPQVDPSTDDNYALYMASFNGHVAIVDRLLSDPRVDPNARDDMLAMVVLNKHIAVMNGLLSDPRVDPSADDNLALRIACDHHRIDMVVRLIQDPRVYPF